MALQAVTLPDELRGVQRGVLEEYVLARIRLFARVYGGLLAPQVPPQHAEIAYAQALRQFGSSEGSTLDNCVLRFRHGCKFLGCKAKDCVLCKNNPHKRCPEGDNMDECFADCQTLKSKCDADVFIEVSNALTGLPQNMAGLELQVCVIDGESYSETSGRVLQLLKSDNGVSLLSSSVPGNKVDAEGYLYLKLQDGCARLPDVSITDKNDTFKMRGDSYGTFRLMGRVVRRDLYGNPVPVASVPPAVCSKFIVKTQRALNDYRKSEYPHFKDELTKLKFIGTITAQRLREIQTHLGYDVPFTSIETVEQLRHLMLYADQNRPVENKLLELLNMKGKHRQKWDYLRDTLDRVVYDDMQHRVWFADEALTQGLMFTCKQGQVNLAVPMGVFRRIHQGNGQYVFQVYKDPEGPTADTMRSWRAFAEQSWVMPNHGRWAMAQDRIELVNASGAVLQGACISPAMSPTMSGQQDAMDDMSAQNAFAQPFSQQAVFSMGMGHAGSTGRAGSTASPSRRSPSDMSRMERRHSQNVPMALMGPMLHMHGSQQLMHGEGTPGSAGAGGGSYMGGGLFGRMGAALGGGMGPSSGQANRMGSGLPSPMTQSSPRVPGMSGGMIQDPFGRASIPTRTSDPIIQMPGPFQFNAGGNMGGGGASVPTPEGDGCRLFSQPSGGIGTSPSSNLNVNLSLGSLSMLQGDNSNPYGGLGGGMSGRLRRLSGPADVLHQARIPHVPSGPVTFSSQHMAGAHQQQMQQQAYEQACEQEQQESQLKRPRSSAPSGLYQGLLGGLVSQEPMPQERQRVSLYHSESRGRHLPRGRTSQELMQALQVEGSAGGASGGIANVFDTHDTQDNRDMELENLLLHGSMDGSSNHNMLLKDGLGSGGGAYMINMLGGSGAQQGLGEGAGTGQIPGGDPNMLLLGHPMGSSALRQLSGSSLSPVGSMQSGLGGMQAGLGGMQMGSGGLGLGQMGLMGGMGGQMGSGLLGGMGGQVGQMANMEQSEMHPGLQGLNPRPRPELSTPASPPQMHSVSPPLQPYRSQELVLNMQQAMHLADGPGPAGALGQVEGDLAAAMAPSPENPSMGQGPGGLPRMVVPDGDSFGRFLNHMLSPEKDSGRLMRHSDSDSFKQMMESMGNTPPLLPPPTH